MAKTNMKRYHIALPSELLGEIQGVADKRGVTVVELFRRFIRLGLIADKVQDTDGSELLIREGKRETRILIP